MNTDNIDQDQLEALEEQTNIISANLKEIQDDLLSSDQLDTLEEQTKNICEGLQIIREFDESFNLDRLEAQLDRIIGKLNKVSEG